MESSLLKRRKILLLFLVACQETGTEPRVDRNRPTHHVMDAAHDAAANPDFFVVS